MGPDDIGMSGLSADEMELLSYLLEEEGLATSASERITPRAEPGEHPMAFAQERMWFVQQIDPDSAAYNIPIALRIRGELNVDALRRSLGEIVRRHESLRAVFPEVDGRPVQESMAAAAPDLHSVDLTKVPPAQAERAALDELVVDAARPFDLAHGPLWRAQLLRLGTDDHIFGMTIHHIVFDGWSIGVFIREMAQVYEAFATGRPSPLPEPELQYSDFAAWQRTWLQGDVLQEQINYWKDQLEDLPVLQLPTDRMRPAVYRSRGASLTVEFPTSLGRELEDLGRREGATLFMTLLAAFDLLLARYSGQDDIVVGSPIANRDQPEIEGIIGYFVNTLVLRTSLGGDITFRQLLARVRDVTLGAYARQNIPFEHLVQIMKPNRDPSYSPMFQVMFILQNAPGGDYRLPNLHLQAIDVDNRTAKFDLTFAAYELPNALGLRVEYNTELFDEDTVRQMAARFERLLSAVVRDPDRALGDYPLMEGDERRMVVQRWSGGGATAVPDSPVYELIAVRAREAPDAPAVTDAQTGLRLSYRDLERRSNQLAHRLRRLGVRPGVLVGVAMMRSPDLIVSMLAVLKAGGTYVPLDPAHPAERLRLILGDAKPLLVLTHGHLANTLPADAPVLCLNEQWPSISGEPDGPPERTATGADLAYVIYTSGSTGVPKGVMVSRASLSNYAQWAKGAFGLLPEDRVLQFASISFDTSAEEIYPCLASGAELVLRDDAMAGDPQNFLRRAGQMGIRVLDLPTIYWHELTRALATGEAALPDCVRLVIIGGERALPERVAAWHAAVLSSVRLVNTYGPTETTIAATMAELRRPDEHSVGMDEAPIGRPTAGAQVYILDDRMEPVPPGLPGEICIAGPGLARGYLGRPDLTAERFVPYAFGEQGARLYRTGDRGRHLRNGDIQFLGRMDQQAKIRGYRVEPGEIETVLRGHPAVRDAVVLVDEPQSGNCRLIGYAVPHHGAEVSAADLQRYLRERLPDYMVPAAIVLLDGLPLSPNGKVNRRALPAPDPGVERSTGEYVAPRTQTEEVLCGIWSEVLGVSQVGAEDNFFDLGGHSLLATQVVSRVRRILQVEIGVRAVFMAPTVAGLAQIVEEAERQREAGAPPRAELAPITPVGRDEPLPLSFAQQRLWFLDQLEPGSTKYHVPLALRLEGDLDLRTLEASLREMARRHEVLRTTFAESDGTPSVIVHPPGPVAMEMEDLRELGEAEREAEVRRRIALEMEKPFDLGAGLLWRSLVLRTGKCEHVVLILLHHIVTDGWSMGILLDEMAQVYAALAQGQPSPLPEPSVQYADYAAWQRRWLTAEVLEEQVRYWRKQLNGAPTVLELPVDRPRSAATGARAKMVQFRLDPDLTGRLRELVRAQDATLYMGLLAAFAVLLHRYTGQEDILIGSPVAHRTRPEVEGLVGFFVNTLIMRARVSGDESFYVLLRRLRETALGAYAHQDLPFEQLVEEIQPARDLNHTPLFQVMFTLQNAPVGTASLDGIRVAPLENVIASAKFDLDLSLEEGPEGIDGTLEYNADLFDRVTVERLAERYVTILEQVAAAPDRAVGDCDLMGQSERRLVLYNWSQGEETDAVRACVQDLIAEHAKLRPAAPAVFAEETGEALSYRDLERRSNQLAHRLRHLGVRPGVLVGVAMMRSPDLIVAMLAILKAGGAYVPLDPAHPAERLRLIVGDAGPLVILSQTGIRPVMSLGAPVLCLDEVWCEIRRESPVPLDSAVSGDDVAYAIYTSGSTGTPKAALIRHAGLVNFARWAAEAFGVQPGQRVLQFASVSFDKSVAEIYSCLVGGAELVLRGERMADSPDHFLRRLGELRINVVDLPTVYWHELVSALTQGAGPLPDTLHTVIIGGERALPDRVELWNDHTDGRIRLVNNYGPTETTVVATAADLSTVGGSGRAGDAVSIGRPVSNMQVYILDGRMEPVPAGLLGELYIGGPGLARGFLNRPDLTAESFVPNPFAREPGARLYATRDLGRHLSDGRIEYLGRVDHQVKILGYRVEPGEIEAHLNRHPKVRMGAVTAHEYGSDDRRLIAYVVPAAGSGEGLAEDVRAFLRGRLPAHMVPTSIVVLSALPLTHSGKVDRRALPVPDSGVEQSTGGYVAPRTPTEEVLCGIWSEVLGVSQVGVEDNFFDLGGHSLLAIRLFSRVERAFGARIPLATLFRSPTVSGIAGQLTRQTEAAGLEGEQIIVPIRAAGNLPPFFVVHPVGGLTYNFRHLAAHLEQGRPLYALQSPGVAGSELTSDRLEVMAHRYVAAIRSLQPAGPYWLAGWSMGGVVAFEMARQMESSGEEVAFLGLMDAFIPMPKRAVAPSEGGLPADVEQLVEFGHNLGVPLHDWKVDWTRWAGLDSRTRFARVVEAARESGAVAADIDEDRLAHLHEVFRSNADALQSYRPQRYGGAAVLFWALEGAAGRNRLDAARGLGWESYVGGGVRVNWVPGDHYSMMAEPNVRALAESLNRELGNYGRERREWGK